MQRTPSKSKTLIDENPFSLSLGDLMAGLLLIFVLLLSFVMLQLKKPDSQKKIEISTVDVTSPEKREKLYKDLENEFEQDLQGWNAVIDREKLSVRFKELNGESEQGKAEVQRAFKQKLYDFFPRYIEILRKPEYVNHIAEIRIEGHTSVMLDVMEKVKPEVLDYVTLREKLYKDLEDKFKHDLSRWNAVLDREKLSVRFKEPDVLFKQGEVEVQPAFKQILDDFFPRYIEILRKPDYENDIAEIRIEGHTSSEWSGLVSQQDAYISNMKLSQGRTRNVLEYVLQIPEISNNKDWIQKHLTANGLSSSRLIFHKDRTENPEESRRVEFRVRINAEKYLERIKELEHDSEESK